MLSVRTGRCAVWFCSDHNRRGLVSGAFFCLNWSGQHASAYPSCMDASYRMIEAPLEARIQQLVEEMLGQGPIYIVDLTLRGTRGSHAIDLYLESDETLGVDTLARLSRELEFLLDAEKLMPGPYTLRVSSPGADRPLKQPRQYRKHLGRSLRVHYQVEPGQNREACGELMRADATGIGVKTNGQVADITFENILWAKVQLPW